MRGKYVFLAIVLMLAATPAFAQRYTTLPQFASGDGWSSDLFLTNQSAQSALGVIVNFYGNDGLPMIVQTNIGTNSSFPLDMNPGVTQTLRTVATGPLRVGYVIVKAPTPGSISVTQVFRYEQAGTVVAELGVPQQGRHHHYSFPVEINTPQGINTGVALANPTYDSSSAVAQSVILNLIHSNGTLFRRVAVPLGRGEHISKYLNEAALFPGLDNFVGYLSISGPRNFGALGLRQDKQAFGAVAVDYGAVLTPFVVTSPLLGEVESNNSNAQAQLLTANCQINGAISYAGDVDYFTFDGRRNDVVSFMTSTQGMGSSCDTVLYLYKADGTQFATSDQNGLYGQNDSLIHVALPDDGRYYLRVSEFSSSGGANYGYRVSVMIPTGVTPPPTITSLNPTSGNQGTSTTIIVSGTNLSGTSAINFSPATGITVSNVQSTATQATAQISIASDATIGTRQVTLTTPGGTSNSLSFTVNQGGGASYDGTWNGPTSGGGTIQIDVTNNRVMKVNVTKDIVCGCCTLSKFGASSSSGALITNGSFTFSVSSSPGSVGFTVQGTFSSPTEGSGSLSGNLQASPTLPCCAGSYSFSWDVSKGFSPAQAMRTVQGEILSETRTVVDEAGDTITITVEKIVK